MTPIYIKYVDEGDHQIFCRFYKGSAPKTWITEDRIVLRGDDEASSSRFYTPQFRPSDLYNDSTAEEFEAARQRAIDIFGNYAQLNKQTGGGA